MSLRLSLVNTYLRLLVRPALARVKTPGDARRHMERGVKRLPLRLSGIHIAEDRIAGPGGPIPVEWVSSGRPDRRRVVIYLHGGAHIMGSPRTHRPITVSLARLSGLRVMVPDFRLAPENPVPAAVDDAVACYSALLAAGYAPGSIALCGESSGGGMCFAVLLELKRLGYPAPACVAAFSPWVDLTMRSNSVRDNAKRDVMLPVERVDEILGYYCGDGDRRDPVASPLYGTFQNPPPTLIQASRSEILLDDAMSLAERLREAGGEVTLELWDNTPHAWQFFAPILPEGREGLERAGTFLRKRLAGCAG